MNPSASHDDLDLIDISNWNTSDHFSFGHNADDSSAFNLSASASNDQQNYYDMNGGDDGTINTVRSTSGNNILGLRKSANPPTISSIYEPKFLEIFNSYSKFASSYEPNLDLSNPASQHLMTLCLNNVLPFSNWARETTTSSYIRATLFENPDMRPEVRNGLALIIVYTFSAAKAADEAEIALNSKPTPNTSGGRGTKDTIDMFSVLMKQETGMGIVNKTSLKMYSDPLGFFNFIKSCISGLIDAAGIPENERQNIQQSKKTRRGSRNKDEVEAFHYLKSSLVAMFQLPETVQLAKDKINQINQFWRLKGNTIRNERFSCVFQLPTPTQSARNSGIREPSLSNGALSLGMRENSQSDETNSTRNNSAINSGINSAMNSANTSGVGPNAFPGMAAAQLQYSQQQAAATALALQQQLQCVSTRTSGRSDISLTVDTSAIPPRSQRLSNNSETFNIYDNNDNDSVSTSSRSPHPGYDAQQAQQAMYNNAGYYTPPAPHMGSHDNSPVLSHHQYTASGQKIYPAINAITVSGAGISSSPMAPQTPPAPAVPVPSIRYDRVGSSKWVANSTLLYDLDSLQNSLSTQSCGTYYLVDESKLKSFLDEAAAQSGGAPVEASNSNAFSDIVLSNYMLSSGINSLEKVLHKSGSLATSWNRFDFSQFRVFVDSWKALQQPNASEGGAGRSRTNSVDSTASRNIFNTGAPPMIADPSAKRPVRRRTTGAIDIRRDMARLSELQEQENMSRLGIDAMHIDNPSPRTEEGGIHPQMFSYGSLPGAQTTGDSNMTAVPNNNGLSNLFGNVQAPAAPSPQPYSGRSSPKTTHANFLGSSNPSLQVPTSPHSSQRGRSASVPALPPSLLEYWQSLTNGNSPGGLFRTASCGILELTKGKGVIVYERSLEVGLIIRANPNYHIMEDAWCLYYPEDVQYTAPTVPFGHPQPPPDINTSFAALLVHLLPQLRNLMRLIQPAPGLQPGMPQQNQNQQGIQYGQQYPSAGYQQQMQMQQQQQHYGTASMHGNGAPPPFDNESPNSIMPPSGNTAGRMGARKSNTFSFSTGGGNDNSLLQFQQQMAAQQAQQQQQQQQVSGFGAPKSGGFGSRAFQDAPQQNVITVSYYSHKMDHNSAFTATNLAIHNNNSGSSNGFHGPPAAPSSGNFYRTVGTLDSQFHIITSKFQEDSYFHDIILR